MYVPRNLCPFSSDPAAIKHKRIYTLFESCSIWSQTRWRLCPTVKFKGTMGVNGFLCLLSVQLTRYSQSAARQFHCVLWALSGSFKSCRLPDC